MKFDSTGGKPATLTVQVYHYRGIDQYAFSDEIPAYNFYENVKRNYSLFDGFISVLIFSELTKEVIDSWLP